jgi:glutamate-ammonia-ligase adenylyltransferase
MSRSWPPRRHSHPLFGQDRARPHREHWQEAQQGVSDAELALELAELRDNPHCTALLDRIFAYSPFLTDCVVKEAAALPRLFDEGAEAWLERCLIQMRDVGVLDDRAKAVSELRIARRRAALGIAVPDLADLWTADQVMQALSQLACAAMQGALSFLLRQAALKGEIALKHPEHPQVGCGYFLLGMGKLGAGELNFSSDIDLIALYEPAMIDYRGKRDVEDFCLRLTRDLVAMLSERTADGYVFRTDLRLRPDPSATPLALSFGAAMSYYGSMGQNWERAAMIKARCVAGDLRLGHAFLAELSPFIWRKSLDFLAIQDIHSIKRQINAVKGGGTIAIEGHNVKLGRGGIREIEFYAQTQQLIWGGRDPSLRESGTKAALDMLAAAGHIPAATASEMKSSYDFLRRVEHRIQMQNDQQTHSLPETSQGVAELADFLGFEDEAEFRHAIDFHFHRVEDHYAELFEEAPSLAGPGNLVFTGDAPEPGTVQTLTELRFASPDTVFNLVRSWHHGRHRATRSQRARELLTEIMPSLLQALGRTANPDAALAKFDEFLRGLPAGVQLFALLAANPRLLDLIAEVMGTAPALAELLTRRPQLLDAVLSPGFFGDLPDRQTLTDELEERLSVARDFEDRLEITRRFANDHKFQAGLQRLQAMTGEAECGQFLADLADVILGAIMPAVEADFARTHGRIAGQGLALVALGKLGSRELTAGSDLDLVALYDSPDEAQSDGGRPLDGTTYFMRLTQRLVAALQAPTGEGSLYQVDLRLRPSGNAGLLAQKLRAFRRYHAHSAWTWEHMALTRARVVLGAPAFVREIEATIRGIQTIERDPEALLRDVHAMRQRLARDKPPKGPWDVKLIPGGLVDCEFIAQYLELRHAAAHPEVFGGSTDRVLERLGTLGLIEPAEAAALAEATRLWRAVQSYLRLTAPGDFDARDVPEAIRPGLAKVAGALDFSALSDTLRSTEARVTAAYRRWIGDPAETLPPPEEQQP